LKILWGSLEHVPTTHFWANLQYIQSDQSFEYVTLIIVIWFLALCRYPFQIRLLYSALYQLTGI
jgi:hypothetical protein